MPSVNTTGITKYVDKVADMTTEMQGQHKYALPFRTSIIKKSGKIQDMNGSGLNNKFVSFKTLQNPLKTKSNLPYIKNQSILHGKHTPSQL